mgnify:CR=1 FL=1
MLLSTLLAVLNTGTIPVSDRVHPDPEVRRVAHDSRTVEPGDLFCCITGAHHDGHDHVEQAVEAGAVAVLAEHPVQSDAPVVVVESVRQTMPLLAAAVVGDPSHDLRVVGVTGTNGKTTTTHFLAAIFASHGWQCEVIGTVSGVRTTPEATDLQRRLAAIRDAGEHAVAMEVSSHALAQQRVDGVDFAATGFTNLGQDHLDYHGSVAGYFEAKASLFSADRTRLAVINRDDRQGQQLSESRDNERDVDNFRGQPEQTTPTPPSGRGKFFPMLSLRFVHDILFWQRLRRRFRTALNRERVIFR